MSRPGLVPVTKLATCKYCGNSQLAWYQNKVGRWYLVEALVVGGTGGTGGTEFTACIFQPHKCPKKGT